MDIQFTVDDQPCSAQAGETLASCMIRQGLTPLRAHPIDASPRAPFCLMGICHECLVEIDGQLGQQACLRQVEPGMIVRRSF